MHTTRRRIILEITCEVNDCIICTRGGQICVPARWQILDDFKTVGGTVIAGVAEREHKVGVDANVCIQRACFCNLSIDNLRYNNGKVLLNDRRIDCRCCVNASKCWRRCDWNLDRSCERKLPCTALNTERGRKGLTECQAIGLARSDGSVPTVCFIESSRCKRLKGDLSDSDVCIDCFSKIRDKVMSNLHFKC